VSSDRRARALRHFREGNRFFERSRYAEALTRYRTAVKAWDHPAIRYNMAVSQVHLDRPLRALSHLKQALRFGAGPLGPALYRRALTYRKLLRGRVARVRVICRQPGVRVTLDGKPLFTAPGEQRRVVLPGKHALVARKEGYLTLSRAPFFIPGRETVVRVRLVPVQQAIRMQRRWRRWWPWATLGAGALVSALGVPLLLQARADLQDYDAEVKAACPRGCQPGALRPAVTDLQDRARAENVAAFVAFGLGGAALVAGITLVILNQPRAVQVEPDPDTQGGAPSARRDRVQVLPAPLPGGGGLTARIRF
jgi:hypothetical protein